MFEIAARTKQISQLILFRVSEKRVNSITSAPQFNHIWRWEGVFQTGELAHGDPELDNSDFQCSFEHVQCAWRHYWWRHQTQHKVLWCFVVVFVWRQLSCSKHNVCKSNTNRELFCCGKIYKTRLIFLETYDNFGVKIQNVVCMHQIADIHVSVHGWNRNRGAIFYSHNQNSVHVKI